jgi:hypothetical protein
MNKKDIVPEYISEDKPSFPKSTYEFIRSGKIDYEPSIIEKLLVDDIDLLQNKIIDLEDELNRIRNENTNLKVKNARLGQDKKYYNFLEYLKLFSASIIGVGGTIFFSGITISPYNLYFVCLGIILMIIFSLILIAEFLIGGKNANG